MYKTKKNTNIFTDTKAITVLALFTALSIVFGKFLAINFMGSYRISFENLPIIVAAAAYGPVAGAIVGITADLVGCILVGYAINPIITAGAAVIGLITGVLCKGLRSRTLQQENTESHSNISYFICSFTAVGTAHIVGSVIIKTLGIYYFFPQPFLLLLAMRFAIYLFTAFAEGLVLYILYQRKIIQMFARRKK